VDLFSDYIVLKAKRWLGVVSMSKYRTRKRSNLTKATRPYTIFFKSKFKITDFLKEPDREKILQLLKKEGDM